MGRDTNYNFNDGGSQVGRLSYEDFQVCHSFSKVAWKSHGHGNTCQLKMMIHMPHYYALCADCGAVRTPPSLSHKPYINSFGRFLNFYPLCNCYLQTRNFVNKNWQKIFPLSPFIFTYSISNTRCSKKQHHCLVLQPQPSTTKTNSKKSRFPCMFHFFSNILSINVYIHTKFTF